MLGASALVAAVAVCMGAAGVPETLDELRVKKLVVVGKDGKSPRWIVDGQSNSLLQVKDVGGTNRVELRHGQSYMTFIIRNTDGKVRNSFGYDSNNSFYVVHNRAGVNTKSLLTGK